MRLEIESIDIKDVQPDSKTFAKDGVLHVNLKELQDLLLKDPRIKSVEANLVYPGDNIRILNPCHRAPRLTRHYQRFR
jgi:glycine reductase